MPSPASGRKILPNEISTSVIPIIIQSLIKIYFQTQRGPQRLSSANLQQIIARSGTLQETKQCRVHFFLSFCLFTCLFVCLFVFSANQIKEKTQISSSASVRKVSGLQSVYHLLRHQKHNWTFCLVASAEKQPKFSGEEISLSGNKTSNRDSFSVCTYKSHHDRKFQTWRLDSLSLKRENQKRFVRCL